MIVCVSTCEKGHSSYINKPGIRRVVWFRCRIRINYILVLARSDIFFDPLKAKRKLLLARKILFFTGIGVIFWQVIVKHEAILCLTSSLVLPLFSIPSMNRLYISAKNEVLHILIPGPVFQRDKLPGCCPESEHVQPIVTSKTTGKSRGLTSLNFALQLGPVRPSGPPHLHSVYILHISHKEKNGLIKLFRLL